MIKVTYQLHGCPEVLEKFFKFKVNAQFWVDTNGKEFSMVSVREVFH